MKTDFIPMPTSPTDTATAQTSNVNEDFVYLSTLEPEDYMEEVLIEDNADSTDKITVQTAQKPSKSPTPQTNQTSTGSTLLTQLLTEPKGRGKTDEATERYLQMLEKVTHRGRREEQEESSEEEEDSEEEDSDYSMA